MDKKEKALYKKAEKAFTFLASLCEGYAVALFYDGKDVNNRYSYEGWGEPDGKTPKEWVRDIVVHAKVFEPRDLSLMDFRCVNVKAEKFAEKWRNLGK